MKIVKIANKYEIKMDDEDYEKFSPKAYIWDIVYRRKGVVKFVRVMPRVSREARKHQKRYRIHRLILGVTDPKLIVDHINRDPLDNRKSNLRFCTAAENSRNSGPKSELGYKGVSKTPYNTYRARITYNDQSISLGSFRTVQAAAAAYDKKAVELFGAFACTNKMLGKLECEPQPQ
jgi:hypothetical protein